MERAALILVLTGLILGTAGSPAHARFDCRAPNRILYEGETACIMTPAGPQMARCGRVLNNTSWEFLQTPCTVRSVPPAEPHADIASPPPAGPQPATSPTR